MILAGVLLKMGTYGLVRFAFPLFPTAAAFFAPYLAVLAVIGIIYGALVAMVQPDMKKLVAYSSVSHLGFVVLGICAMNMQGVQGAVYQMLEPRRQHRRPLPHRRHAVGPAAHAADRRVRRPEEGRCRTWSAAFLIVTLASIGLPGLNGFVGEFLILLGAFRWEPRLAAFAATGVILSADLHALDVPARELRPGDQREERGAAGPDAARVGGASCRSSPMAILMGVLPNLFLQPDRAVGRRGCVEPGAGAGRRRASERAASRSGLAIRPTDRARARNADR